jgi:lipopolysaccharide transport system ATP-binding protein
VGIIGRNGSGKSTLLQMIAGTLTPTSGTIKVHGRVAALLELGSGFNPDFTGRENVYLNASVLGLTKEEIDARYKEIADFADIGDFIEQPVKTYSSGMTMRLAFAVIANIDADVLIIDEAFAVGDVFFQQKCMRFLREFQQKSGTLLFVSHDMCAVTRLCQQAVLLTRQGEEQSMFVDSAETISKRYLGKIYEERADTLTHTESVARRPSAMSSSVIQEYKAAKMETSWIHISPFRHDAESFGQNGGNIIGACFTDNSDHPLTEAQAGEIVKLVVTATTRKPMTFPAFGFIIKDRTGQYIIAESTDIPLRKNQIIIDKPAQIKTTFKFRMPTLIRGEYTVNLAFAEGPGDEHVQHHWIHDAISLKSTDKRLVHGLFGAQDMEISVVVKASQ